MKDSTISIRGAIADNNCNPNRFCNVDERDTVYNIKVKSKRANGPNV
jgi:hypothetical protein